MAMPPAAISAWLVPWEPESAILQQLMARHPEPVAPHSFPHFHPHVTLATVHVDPPPPPPPPNDSETAASASSSTGTASHDAHDAERAALLLALREAVPFGQRSIRVRFARVLAGDHYHRSIYAAIAPSDELAQLRGALAGVRGQGRGGAPPAFPHLSLYYVGEEEAHVRARYLQELEREGVVRHSGDGLSAALWCAGEDGVGRGGGAVLEGFTGTQIWIVDCEGPVEGWRVLDKILLAKSEG